MALKFLPHYPNLDHILESIPDLKTDQIRRIIEMLYISASDQTRTKVDIDVEIDCRENRIQSYLRDDQLFREQMAEDLRDWMDLPEDFRYVEWIYNEDYDDFFCPDCEEYFVSDPYQLADLILKILWDARVAAKRHDWPLTRYLIETVYIEMEESVTQFGDFREDDNLVDRLQEYCWNEYRADETI